YEKCQIEFRLIQIKEYVPVTIKFLPPIILLHLFAWKSSELSVHHKSSFHIFFP
ncbi:MAG: hypothetical protein ACJA0H_002467, partial [Francisellaceae bacterium]